MRHDFLTIDLAPFARRTTERMERLAAAREAVVSDPEILGGIPVLRGTRVPVYDVASSVEDGLPMERILAAYPSIDRERVDLAALYAEANPPRGRPRSSGAPPDAGVLVDKRVPRRWRGRMKFLVDECLSPELTKLARAEEFGKSSHVVWLGRAGLKDWGLKLAIL